MAFKVNRGQSVRKAGGDTEEEAAPVRKGAGERAEVRESANKLIIWQKGIGSAGAGRRWRERREGRRGWRVKRRETSGGARVAVPGTAEVGLKGLEASGEA